jgi:cell division septal protein FtsQ
MNLTGRKAKRNQRLSRLEQRISKQKKSSGNLKRTILLSTISSIIAGGYFAYQPVWNYLCHQSFFNIKEVTISGNPHIDNQYLLSLLPPIKGQNLLGVDSDYIKGTLALHPWIKDNQVHKRLPDRLTIAIVERKPLALVNADRLLAMDNEGVLLPLESRQGSVDVPLLICPRGTILHIGQTVNDKRIQTILPTLEALRLQLPELWELISEVSWDDRDQVVMISTLSRAPIVFGKKPTWEQMINLYSFLQFEGRRSDLMKLNSMDLRFSGQVVIKRNPTEAEKNSADVNNRKRTS